MIKWISNITIYLTKELHTFVYASGTPHAWVGDILTWGAYLSHILQAIKSAVVPTSWSLDRDTAPFVRTMSVMETERWRVSWCRRKWRWNIKHVILQFTSNKRCFTLSNTCEKERLDSIHNDWISEAFIRMPIICIGNFLYLFINAYASWERNWREICLHTNNYIIYLYMHTHIRLTSIYYSGWYLNKAYHYFLIRWITPSCVYIAGIFHYLFIYHSSRFGPTINCYQHIWCSFKYFLEIKCTCLFYLHLN